MKKKDLRNIMLDNINHMLDQFPVDSKGDLILTSPPPPALRRGFRTVMSSGAIGAGSISTRLNGSAEISGAPRK